MDKVTSKFSSPYVSPYLRRPLRSLTDALSEREAEGGYRPHERRRAAHGEAASRPQREQDSA